MAGVSTLFGAGQELRGAGRSSRKNYGIIMLQTKSDASQQTAVHNQPALEVLHDK